MGGVACLFLVIFVVLFINNYYIKEPENVTCNWLFSGLPSFILGWKVNECSLNKRFSFWVIVFLTFFFLIGTIFEYHYSPIRMGDLFFTTIPLSFFVFLIFLKKDNIGIELLWTIGKKYSMWIYIFHVMIIALIKHLFSYLSIMPSTKSGLLGVLLVAIVSTGISHIVKQRIKL